MTMPVLMTIWDSNLCIGVDAHVRHITDRLKRHKPPTKPPEETG